MAGPTATDSALSHLAAAALAALDGAEPDPTLDEIADAIQAGFLLSDPARPRVLVIDPVRREAPAIRAGGRSPPPVCRSRQMKLGAA